MPKSRKQETNVQFVKRIMEYGSPMKQLIVLEGIRKYAEACAKADPKTFDSDWLHGPSWVACAKEIADEFRNRGK